MELAAAIKGRRSIRKFKSQDVPKSKITEILEEARWSPSWGNTQTFLPPQIFNRDNNAGFQIGIVDVVFLVFMILLKNV